MENNRDFICSLMDTYANIIPSRQREALEYYYFEDLSLSEAAEHMGITRQGVRDAIKSGVATLMNYEEGLSLLAKTTKTIESAGVIIDLTDDQRIKNLAQKIISDQTS